jgi:hypothetical protein
MGISFLPLSFTFAKTKKGEKYCMFNNFCIFAIWLVEEPPQALH